MSLSLRGWGIERQVKQSPQGYAQGWDGNGNCTMHMQTLFFQIGLLLTTHCRFSQPKTVPTTSKTYITSRNRLNYTLKQITTILKE